MNKTKTIEGWLSEGKGVAGETQKVKGSDIRWQRETGLWVLSTQCDSTVYDPYT